MEPIKLTEKISYFPQAEDPLSADVYIVRGDKRLFVYDAGNRPDAALWLNAQDDLKTVVISHFHKDHTANLSTLNYDELYVGRYTLKALGKGTVADTHITITDGIKADIIPVPSSHAKGSLLMMIDDEYLFAGDATYSMLKDGRRVHNAQLLKEQIDIISALPADKIILSHDLGKIRKKAVVLRLLKSIYSKRTSDSPYIYVD